MALTKLNRQKGALKAKITSVEDYLDALQERLDPNNQSKPTLVELQFKFDVLKNIGLDVDTLREKYYDIAKDEEI